MNRYDNRLHILTKEYDELISRENEKILPGNGVFEIGRATWREGG